MADDYDDSAPAKRPAAEKSRPKTDEAAFIREALKRYDRGFQADRENIARAIEDLEFRRGEPEDQWGAAAIKERDAQSRPSLVINQIPQFVEQITGDIRQMRPSMKLVPVDTDDEQLAEKMTGLVRYIENRSEASAVYYAAADSQVACGVGHWRVLAEYESARTFNQEIRIAPIKDQVNVIWDPDAQSDLMDDALWCFVPEDISFDAFKARYPKATTDGFDAAMTTLGISSPWPTGDMVRVCEYWLKKPIKKLMAQSPEGSMLYVEDAAQAAEMKAAGWRVEERESYEVCRYLITSREILEGPEIFPASYIPIVRVVGKQVTVNGKTYRHGVVRYLKGPQRLFNYMTTALAESTALQPKAPWIGTERNFEEHPEWETANTQNHAFLTYTPDPANGNAAPQRVQPPVASSAINEGIQLANEVMRSTTGIYDASLGAKSNETSGVAIRARQVEGDTVTYVYSDNMARAIRHSTRIVADMIPKIYDSSRTMRILGNDGKMQSIEINKPDGLAIEGQPQKILNDVTIGSYDVQAESGPSFTTKREQAKEAMAGFLQAVPDVAPAIVDLFVKAQDWPYAQEIGERLELLLPPPIQAYIAAKKQGAAPEKVVQPQQPEPDPSIIADAQLKQAQAEKLRVETAMMVHQMQSPSQAEMPAPQPDPMEALHGEVIKKRALGEVDLEFEARRKRLERDAGQMTAVGLDSETDMPGATPLDVLTGALAQQSQAIEMQGQAIGQGMGQMAEAIATMARVMSAPKQVVRDGRGRVAGVETVGA